MLLLHVHALDARAEVGGDLLLVARLRVHDVPGARAGPRVVDDRRLLLLGGVVGRPSASAVRSKLTSTVSSASASVARRLASTAVGVERRLVGVVVAASAAVGVGAVVVESCRVGGQFVSVVVSSLMTQSYSQPESTPKRESRPTDVGGVDDDRDEHDDREAADLGPLRPGDLAHLVAHLARGTAPGRPARPWCAAPEPGRGWAGPGRSGHPCASASASALGSGRRVTFVLALCSVRGRVRVGIWAGQEGFEPPTVGFGDRCSTS